MEVVAEEGIESIQPRKPAREKKTFKSKPKVKCPGASEKAEWDAINTDLSSTLKRMWGAVE